MPVAILALTLSAFGIGTSEFVINGLLPDIARDLAVSIPVAGLLISGFAIGIIVGAPVLTLLTLRLPRKGVLQGALVLFIAGSAVSACASTYGTLMTGRVISATAVGAFYGVGSVIAASLAPTGRQASAVAMMFAGATAATVLGVPLGTLIGQELGWRTTYWIVTAIGGLGLAGVSMLVPPLHRRSPTPLRAEFSAFSRLQVWLALGMTACSFGAIAAVFTYIAPLLHEVTGYSDKSVTALLFVIGLGLFAGNLLGGKLADSRLMPSMIGMFGAFALVLVVLFYASHDRLAAAACVFLFGLAGYALVPMVQVRVMSSAQGAPTLASAVNISAFNVGVMLGSVAGGVAIDLGWGFASVTLVAAAIASTGLLLAIVSHGLDRRQRGRGLCMSC